VLNVNKVRDHNTPLDPDQAIDLHPHVQSIAKLNRQLECADITLEDRETIEAKMSQYLKDRNLLSSDMITR
jgi:hypothetical protein